MNKPFIKMIRVFSNNECVASVDDGNGFLTEFTAPNEAVKDLNMRQRYDYMEARAQKYIACIEPVPEVVNEVVDDLPFPEKYRC